MVYNKSNNKRHLNRNNSNDSTDLVAMKYNGVSQSTNSKSGGKDQNTTHRPKSNSNSKKRRASPNKYYLQPLQPSQFVAMDCEMVGVGFDGLDSTLARVTIVDWDGGVILDQYVKPTQEVVDYRTYVSGITAADMEREGITDIITCRQRVLELLDGKVVVGHGLKNDFIALGISHPWHMIRDTAKYEPCMKIRFNDGILWPRKLKELCQEILNKEIQCIGQPHSSFEDAVAAMELYKVVQIKWENLIKYKLMKTALILEQQQKLREETNKYQQQFPPLPNNAIVLQQ